MKKLLSIVFLFASLSSLAQSFPILLPNGNTIDSSALFRGTDSILGINKIAISNHTTQISNNTTALANTQTYTTQTYTTQTLDSTLDYVTPYKSGLKENSLGNPTTDGYVLSSSIVGVRTWIAPSTGSSYTETDPVVKAINGIVKSNGTTISAAVAGDFPVLPYVDLSTPQTILGVKSLQGSTTTDAGAAALILKNSSGAVAFEFKALASPTNLALGISSFPAITTGLQNTGFGTQVGLATTTGGSNFFAGYQAGYSNIGGSFNNSLGAFAGYSNTTGNNNADYGLGSGRNRTTGSVNANYGSYSGYSNIAGGNNVSLGYYSLYNATAPNYTVAVGEHAATSIADGSTVLTTVSQGVFLGYNAHPFANSSNGEIVIGSNAIGFGNNTATLGNSSNAGIYGYGSLNLKSYGTGTNTGTATYNLQVNSAGKVIETVTGGKLILTTGANQSVGTATLAGGTITVSNTSVTASSQIMVSVKTAGGTQGFLSVPTITAGTSFVIQSSSATETSIVNYWIIN